MTKRDQKELHERIERLEDELAQAKEEVVAWRTLAFETLRIKQIAGARKAIEKHVHECGHEGHVGNSKKRVSKKGGR